MSIRLLGALWRREAGWGWLATVIAGAAVAAWAAHLTPQLMSADGPDLVGRALRRFDLTLLGVSAVLVSLRMAQRVGVDTSSGWLEPLMAAGTKRWSYGVALAIAVTAATWLAFLIGAATFAVGVQVSAGSGELLRLLPRLAAAGLVLLIGFALFSGAFALLIREPVSAMLVTGAAFALPYVIIVSLAQRQQDVPPLAGWLTWYTPGPYVAQSFRGAVMQLVYAGAVAAVVAWISHRVAGRRP